VCDLGAGTIREEIDAMKVIGGLGPELSRIVDGSTSLAIEGEKSVYQIGELIDRSQPALNSQVQTADSIATRVQHMASITEKRAPTVDLCESDEALHPAERRPQREG
jgi:ABC-type transporter Mla subunit MlaD